MQASRLFTILLVSLFFSTSSSAQVFDPGPSDSLLFTEVIDLPGGVLPAPVGGIITLGGVVGETTQLNINAGGNPPTDSFLDIGVGSEVNVDGGILTSLSLAMEGSEVNIIDGAVGMGFGALAGSTVNISGGFVGTQSGFTGSVVNISGGLLDTSIFAGGGSVVNITGGDLGGQFVIEDSEVNISGGFVGIDAVARGSSVLNISDGLLGNSFDAESGSEVNISGGIVQDFFEAMSGSVVNISGGSVGDFFQALDGSEVNISGGTSGIFVALDGSTVNLFGSAFVINGVLLENLVEGQAFTITDRNVPLIGQLADGTNFSFNLNNDFTPLEDAFDSGATLTVTLTPPFEPEFLLGDANQDGSVNFLDIAPFISLLSNSTFLGEADVNEDEVVSFLDISPFITILSTGG